MMFFRTQTIAEFSTSTEKYTPVKRFNINQRINYKAKLNKCGDSFFPHILMLPIEHFTRKALTKEEREQRYITSCLERGERPHNFPDHEWEIYWRDIND